MFIISKKVKTILSSFFIGGMFSLYILFSQIPDNKFHIYFLDVGQGDSVFIKTPQNHQILIDGGEDNSVIENLGKIMSFFDKSIDLVVLTHPHKDHVGGLIEITKRFEVENVLITGVYNDDPYYLEFLQNIKNLNSNVFIANADTDFLFKDVLLDVIYPFDEISYKSFENLNNSSIVIKVFYKDEMILLTGDIEKIIEEEIINSGIEIDSDILKVAHHGSKTSSSLEFLKKVSPEISVIQCGKNNKFGHPNDGTLQNLSSAGVKEIYRTDEDGMIEFVF